VHGAVGSSGETRAACGGRVSVSCANRCYNFNLLLFTLFIRTDDLWPLFCLILDPKVHIPALHLTPIILSLSFVGWNRFCICYLQILLRANRYPSIIFSILLNLRNKPTQQHRTRFRDGWLGLVILFIVLFVNFLFYLFCSEL
jgi:hypothetical protein